MLAATKQQGQHAGHQASSLVVVVVVVVLWHCSELASCCCVAAGHRGTFYPGTGAATEVGQGDGAGFTVNVPWDTDGVSDGDYMAAMQQVSSRATISGHAGSRQSWWQQLITAC